MLTPIYFCRILFKWRKAIIVNTSMCAINPIFFHLVKNFTTPMTFLLLFFSNLFFYNVIITTSIMICPRYPTEKTQMSPQPHIQIQLNLSFPLQRQERVIYSWCFLLLKTIWLMYGFCYPFCTLFIVIRLLSLMLINSVYTFLPFLFRSLTIFNTLSEMK